MLELFERVSDDIPNVTKICGCTNHADHFRIQLSYTSCPDCDPTGVKKGKLGGAAYIKCIRSKHLIIYHSRNDIIYLPYEYYDPYLSIHTKCNIDFINDAYKQLVRNETKELYNKICLVYRDTEFHDIIRYSMLILISHEFRYLK
jgi:hypothetical protein